MIYLGEREIVAGGLIHSSEEETFSGHFARATGAVRHVHVGALPPTTPLSPLKP